MVKSRAFHAGVISAAVPASVTTVVVLAAAAATAGSDGTSYNLLPWRPAVLILQR